MSLDKLKNQIEEKKLGGLYYIHGDEAFLMHFYISEMKKSLFDSDSVRMDFSEFSDYSDSQDFLTFVNSFPVLAEKKMAVLTDLTEKSEIAQLILSDPGMIDDSVVLVLFAQTRTFSQKTKEGKAFAEFVKKRALNVEIKKLDPQTLVKWIKKQCRLCGSEISDSVAQHLLSVNGNEMFSLFGECRKLSAYCGTHISAEDVDKVAVKNSDITAFNVTNALLSKDLASAHRFAGELLKGVKGTDSLMYITPVFNMVGSMYKVKMLADKGLLPVQIASELGMSEYPARLQYNAVKSISVERLEKMIDRCTDADLSIKNSGDPNVVFASLIEELAL